jgi:cation transporter-like permease
MAAVVTMLCGAVVEAWLVLHTSIATALSLVVLILRAITVAAAVSRPQADDQSSALPSPCENKRVAYTAGDTRRQVALTT